jgi:hypothetical protein
MPPGENWQHTSLQISVRQPNWLVHSGRVLDPFFLLDFHVALKRRTSINAALEWGKASIRGTGTLIAVRGFVVVSGAGINPASSRLSPSTESNEEYA